MEIKNVLQKYNFRFKKALGQNFISDDGLLKAIVRDAGIEADDLVLEIGAGAGTLTRALAEKARAVYAFDVDEALGPVLAETLAGTENVRVFFRDVLKMSDRDLDQITEGAPFKVVANLPYYITTPLIMRFIESELPVRSLTVMVQKEVADRLVAKADTPEYGSVTLAVRLRGEAQIIRKVGRGLFFPQPGVDSAVVRIDIKDDFASTPTLKKLIRAGFAMRRKTFVNNIVAAFAIGKEEASALLSGLGYNENVRGEALALEDYIKIASVLAERK